MKSLRSDQQGIAHLLLIVLVIVVVAVIGAAGWVVLKKNKTTGSTSAGSKTTVASSKQVATSCNQLYNDTDLCKFTASWNEKQPYKATFTSVDGEGKSSVMLVEQDSKDNSSLIVKDGNTVTMASITLNGDDYLKDMTDGTWTKYPKQPNSQNVTNPSGNLEFDASSEAAKPTADRTTYKKLGKEKCGSATCFKYAVIDPTQPNVKESLIWFGDKDYQLRKWSFKDADGTSSTGEFTFTKVNITAPSPVKSAPTDPTAQ